MGLYGNDALARAVSEVQIRIDGWAAPHIFQLFECSCAMGFAATQNAKGFYSLRVVEKALLIQSLD